MIETFPLAMYID